MRVLIQRTAKASVSIDGQCKSAIGQGLLVLIGIEATDGSEDIEWLCKKIIVIWQILLIKRELFVA